MKGGAMMNIEDRIFELTGHEADAAKIFDAVVAEYGVDRETARNLYVKAWSMDSGLRFRRVSRRMSAMYGAAARRVKRTPDRALRARGCVVAELSAG